jgi:sialic acid synthase SpsE
MVKFIADIGSNHNGNIKRLFELIHIAKNIGCWGVKIQLFQADKLIHKPSFSEEFYKTVKKRELPRDWIPEIKNRCEMNDLKFGATPFDMEAIQDMKAYVDFVKISSFDIERHDLIKSAASLLKPIMISTGMISDAIELIVVKNIIQELNNDYTFLHCVSKYPTRLNEVNLENIISMIKYVGLDKVGYSDHTTNEIAIYESINYNAKVIEFHLDNGDEQGFEADYGHCWKPQHIARVIENVNNLSSMLKKGYATKEELSQRADPFDGLRPMREMRSNNV